MASPVNLSLRVCNTLSKEKHDFGQVGDTPGTECNFYRFDDDSSNQTPCVPLAPAPMLTPILRRVSIFCLYELDAVEISAIIHRGRFLSCHVNSWTCSCSCKRSHCCCRTKYDLLSASSAEFSRHCFCTESLARTFSSI